MHGTLTGRIVIAALSYTAAISATTISPASADPLPYGPDTCANGYVWREARPGDTVCVTPDMRATIAQQNGNAGANKDPSQAYGPESCSQGYVWRQAFDGDTICVTPGFRTTVLADNAAAASHKATGQSQHEPAPQAGTVSLKLTGSGTANTIDVYDPTAEARRYDVALPYERSVNVSPRSGDLYEIVGLGKGSTAVGCTISVNGNVVAEQPIGGSGQCVYTAP